MSRPLRIGLIGIAGLLLLALIIVAGGFWLLRTDWFFQQVRDRAIAEIERSTGGRVELRRFHFDWKTLIAEADGLVVHGTEPASEPPLFRAARLKIGLKLISLAKRQVDVASIDVTDPQVNLILSPDGHSNIPEPKTPRSGKSVGDTILDLAVGRFDIAGGAVQVKAAGRPPERRPWTARGENLKAQFAYSRRIWERPLFRQSVHSAAACALWHARPNRCFSRCRGNVRTRSCAGERRKTEHLDFAYRIQR